VNSTEAPSFFPFSSAIPFSFLVLFPLSLYLSPAQAFPLLTKKKEKEKEKEKEER
jgi:hypothetical protein